MLISASFFVGQLSVPNTSTQNVSERLTYFINKFEPVCLSGILGYELYKAYKASPTDERFANLTNGAEYTDECGNLAKWIGLVYDTNKSLIANFIYFKWKADETRQSTGFGTIGQQPEKGILMSPAYTMIDIWNEFSDQVKSMVGFLLANDTVYPEFDIDTARKSLYFSYPVNDFDI